MKRRHPLSRSLALLAATHMSLAPALAPIAFADMQTQATSTDVITTRVDDSGMHPGLVTTRVDDSGMFRNPETTTEDDDTTAPEVTTDNLADIIKSLTSTDIRELQTRYNELLDLIRAKKHELTQLTDAEDIAAVNAEITDMENLAAAFKAIIEGYEDSGAKTVVKTETYIDEETGYKVTRTTYSDGSYTETVETDIADDEDSDSEGESGSGSGGGSDFLQQMLQNPMVQGLITGLLQKLLSGGLGNISSLLGDMFGNTPKNGDTLVGKVCDSKAGQKCSTSDYSTPSPQSKAANSSGSPDDRDDRVSPNSSGSPDDRDNRVIPNSSGSPDDRGTMILVPNVSGSPDDRGNSPNVVTNLGNGNQTQGGGGGW